MGDNRELTYWDPMPHLASVFASQPQDMQEDPWSGWACDGDANWTPALVRQWWRDRRRLRYWLTTKYRRWNVSDRAAEREAATGLTDYLAYLNRDLPDHLRAYLYFLDTGVTPNPDDRLPPL